VKRRPFLKSLAAGLAVSYLIPRSVLAAPGTPGASDRVAVAVIGCGNRVCTILNEAPPALDVVALADCDLRQVSGESNFGKRVSKMEHLSDGFLKWPRYQDYRQMFDKEKLEAVIVTTTTHARALATWSTSPGNSAVAYNGIRTPRRSSATTRPTNCDPARAEKVTSCPRSSEAETRSCTRWKLPLKPHSAWAFCP